MLERNGAYKINPQRRRTKEPKAKRGKPVCPKHLTGHARTEWKSVTQVLDELGVLYKTDRSSLEQYAKAYGAWRDCWEQITRIGYVVTSKDERTGQVTVKRNPFVLEAHQFAALCLKYLQEFGLTPASRSRVEKADEPDDSPFEQWLRDGTDNKN